MTNGAYIHCNPNNISVFYGPFLRDMFSFTTNMLLALQKWFRTNCSRKEIIIYKEVVCVL